MIVHLKYNGSELELKLPENCRIDQFSPIASESSYQFDSFAALIEKTGGLQFLYADNPLVIVNDGFRNTPTAQILAWLDQIDDTFSYRASVLIATGTHPAPTKDHIEAILGQFANKLSGRIHYHDAKDRSKLRSVGTDQFGKDVYLNSSLSDHDAIIIIGSVEPHYFAGFTGGRKALFPGLTDLATIARNHNLACDLKAAPLKLKGNPVAEHLDSLLDFVDLTNVYSIQAINSPDGSVADLYAGGIRESFSQATISATENYAHMVENKYDLLIAEILPPFDLNLYQIQKGLENSQGVIKDSGMILLLSSCSEGVGSSFFFDLARTWNREKNCSSDGITHFGSHKLARVNSIGNRIQIMLHSSLSPEIVRQVFYEPSGSPQELIDKFLGMRSNPKIALVEDAAHTVLQHKNDV